jgi:putative endonuclease
MKAVEFERVQRPSPFIVGLIFLQGLQVCISGFCADMRIMPHSKTYTVYLIVNQVGRRYIGLSECIFKRLDDHNNGRSFYTAKYRPWKLVWNSLPLTLSEARKLENLLKKQKGGVGLDSLLKKHRGS